MQSIIASCVYKNKSFDYINASFIYIIKACIYSFRMMQRKFGSYTKEVYPLYKRSFPIIVWKLSANTSSANYR